MRIALIISSMGPGGAERVMANLANTWSRAGHDISIHTFSSTEDPVAYTLSETVKLVPLNLLASKNGKMAAITDAIGRIITLRRQWKATKPDIILSFIDLTNIIVILSSIGLKIPTFVSERSNPALNTISRIWSSLRLWTYPLASGVIVQTKAAGQYFPRHIRRRIHILPNPVLTPEKYASPGGTEIRQITAMGRLGSEKGFDVLFRALAMVLPQYPEWRATVLGEGKMRGELEKLRDSLGLRGRIDLPGLSRNPVEQLATSEIFVLASRYEGFPNALLEAMAVGLPVISTDFPGHEELVTDGHDALVVPVDDAEALAAAIRRLISDAPLRKSLGHAAGRVQMRFSLDLVTQSWNKVLGISADRR